MNSRTKWVVNAVFAAGVSAVVLPACGKQGDATAESETRTGIVELNLLSQGTSGVTYRLRNAVLMVQGPSTTLIINSEDDPDATVLTHSVPEGDYSIFLHEGWSLERLDADAGASTVQAQLQSPNPDQFHVHASTHTVVPLQFRVGTDITGQGSFGVTLSVDDSSQPAEFCANDAECASGETCCLAGFLGTCVTLQDAQACPLPDLTISQPAAEQSLFLDHAFFAADSCAMYEGCVDAPGNRALLRFDTETPNIGEADMILGTPGEALGFEHSACHGHYHFEGYAQYEVFDLNGVIAATGHKQAFCLMDLSQNDPAAGPSKFHCGFQGISRGWSDIYGRYLDCQWVDVTDLAPGDYLLRISLNPDQILPESDYTNNVAEVAFNIPDPANIDPLELCSAGEVGLARDCGWSVAPGFDDVACQPGEPLVVGCGCNTGGTCTGDTMVRICDGTAPCTNTNYIAASDDSCGVCPEASVACPASGHYSVLVAPYYSNDSAAICEVAVGNGPLPMPSATVIAPPLVDAGQ